MEGKLEPKGSLHGTSKWKRLLSVASLIMLALTVFVLLNYEKFLPEPELKSIAVLPFKSLSADPNDQYLADGFYEEIITRLSMQQNLLVIGKQSTDQVAAAGLSSNEISQRLNVQYLLTGSLRREDDNLRITTRLEDARTGQIVSTKTLNRKISGYFNLWGEVSLQVVRDIGITMNKGLAQSASTDNLKAFELWKLSQRTPGRDKKNTTWKKLWRKTLCS